MLRVGDKILCKNGYITWNDEEVKSSRWYKICAIIKLKKNLYDDTAYKISTFTGFRQGKWIMEFYDKFTPRFEDHFYTEQEIRKRKLLKLKEKCK